MKLPLVARLFIPIKNLLKGGNAALLLFSLINQYFLLAVDFLSRNNKHTIKILLNIIAYTRFAILKLSLNSFIFRGLGATKAKGSK